MNIVSIIDKIISSLGQKSCDLCWNFVFGGREDYFNLAQQNQECECCCATVGILRNSMTTGFSANNNFSTKSYRDWNLEIFAGIPSRLDIQFFNEVDPNKTEESKWVKYLYPILCCLQDIDTQICDEFTCQGNPTSIEIRSWNFEMKLNYADINFDGWLIRTTIREWIS